MHLADVLEAAVRRDPAAPAVYEGHRLYSYSELSALVARLAAALGPLRRLCPEGGSPYPPRVAILAGNSAYAVAAFFATAAAGLIAVPLTPDLDENRLAAFLAHSEASAVLVPQTLLSRVLAVRDQTPSVRLLVTDAPWDSLPPGPSTGPASAGRSTADLAAIVYTSGSTGRPKGVMLTHEALVSNARAVVKYLDLRASDRSLLVLPLGYIMGLSVLLTHVVAGASLVLQRRFLFPSVVIDALAEYRCTGFYGVPATYALLLRSPSVLQANLSSLRYLAQAGGALAPELQARLCEAFPGARLYVMYGATEAGPRISYHLLKRPNDARSSVGKPIAGVTVRVVDDDGLDVPCGDTGEILVKSPGLMLGYWRDEEATRRVLRDGWYRTGDLGLLSEAGELTITGRTREFIKVRGHRIGLGAIESVLAEIPGIVDVAVIGVADELLGEAPVAYFVGAPCDVAVRAARLLPGHMRPVAYHRVPSLPRTASGKVDRRGLLELHLGASSESM
ncbi:MAG: class I adenylate-forming enzyme family protein [bacterium]